MASCSTGLSACPPHRDKWLRNPCHVTTCNQTSQVLAHLCRALSCQCVSTLCGCLNTTSQLEKHLGSRGSMHLPELKTNQGLHSVYRSLVASLCSFRTANCRSQERVRHVMPGGAVSIFPLRVRLPEEVIPTCSSEPPTTHTPLASTVESGTTKHKSIEAQQDEHGKTHLSILSLLAQHSYWLVKSNGLLAPLDRNVLPKY